MLTFFIIIISDNEVELWFEQVIILPPCVHAFTAETRPHAVEDAYTHAHTHTLSAPAAFPTVDSGFKLWKQMFFFSLVLC